MSQNLGQIRYLKLKFLSIHILLHFLLILVYGEGTPIRAPFISLIFTDCTQAQKLGKPTDKFTISESTMITSPSHDSNDV